MALKIGGLYLAVSLFINIIFYHKHIMEICKGVRNMFGRHRMRKVSTRIYWVSKGRRAYAC